MVEPMTAEARLNGVIYASLADALAIAEAGDTVEIISEELTPAENLTVPNGVTIQAYKAQQDDPDYTYRATGTVADDAADVTIDAKADGSIVLKDGRLALSANTPVQVHSPVDEAGYSVIAPDCASEVVADRSATPSEAPYLTGDEDGVVQIGNVRYTYTNIDDDNKTQVSIPDAMAGNVQVTKAEISGNLPGSVKTDDGETVEFLEGGTATDHAVAAVTRTNS